MSEAIGPLLKEKEKMLNDHNVYKEKLERRYEEQDKRVKSYEMEFRTLLSQNSKIREYVMFSCWISISFCKCFDQSCQPRYNELKKCETLKKMSDNKALQESQLRSCDIRLQEISAELTKSNEWLQNQERVKRIIEDNVNYRKTKQKVDQLACDIKLMEMKIVNIGGVSKFEAELDKLKQERERFSSEVW